MGGTLHALRLMGAHRHLALLGAHLACLALGFGGRAVVDHVMRFAGVVHHGMVSALGVMTVMSPGHGDRGEQQRAEGGEGAQESNEFIHLATSTLVGIGW